MLGVPGPESSQRGGATERGVWLRAGFRYSSGVGGCCGYWNVGLNGRCFGSRNRRCYGRRHGSRYGTRAGSRSDAMTGRGSGRRHGAGTRCCWGSSIGGRCEGRSWDRSVGCCSSRNGRGFRRCCGGCCGCRNRGRIRGKDSPSCPGYGGAEAIQRARCRVQNSGTAGKETTWEPTKDDVRFTRERAVLRLGVVGSLIPVTHTTSHFERACGRLPTIYM